MKRTLVALVAMAALASSTGCETTCDKFKKDPNKYDFTSRTLGKDQKPTQLESGPFVVAVFRPKGTPKDDVMAAIKAAVDEAGGGTVSDEKDDGDYVRNFARRVPYSDKPIQISFETKFKSKDLKVNEPLIMTWKGGQTPLQVEVNKFENDKPVPGYPTVSKIGDTYVLKVPSTLPLFAAPGESGGTKPTLVYVDKIEEKATGGFKFRGALPLSIKSRAQNADVEIVWAEKDGNADVLRLEQGDTIDLYRVENFKGNPRDIQCRLLPTEVESKSGYVKFTQQRMDFFLTASGSGGEATKIVVFSGSTTESGGKVKNVEWKLPEGFPSMGKKVADAKDLEAAGASPGDYWIDAQNDEAASKISFTIKMILKTGGDPQYMDVMITPEGYKNGAITVRVTPGNK